MNFLNFFTANFFLFLVSTTVVQAFPIPTAGFFESSTKAIKGFMNSKKFIPKETESSALDSNMRRINLLPSEPTEDKILNVLPVDSNQQKVTDAISLSQRKLNTLEGNAKAAARSVRQVDLDLDLAKLNAMKAESELKIIPMKLDKVNENWEKKMGEETLISRNPSSSTLGSEIQGTRLLSTAPVDEPLLETGLVKLILQKSLAKAAARSVRQVDLDLDLAKLNAMKAESESTTALVKIDKVNEMWKKKMGEEDLISRNPSSESEIQGTSLLTTFSTRRGENIET